MSALNDVIEDVYPLGSEKPDGPAAFLAMLQQLARNRGAGLGRAADAGALTALFSDIDFTGFTVLQQDTLQLWTRKAGATIPMPVNSHRQLDTTNDIVALKRQVGIGMITGAAATLLSEAVTFPVAFKASTFPVLSLTFVGALAGAFNPAGTAPSTGVSCRAAAVSPTGFTAYLDKDTVMSAGTNYYYAWTADGEVA